MNRKIDSYLHFDKISESYGDEYSSTDLKKTYPANKFRLNIIISLLKKIRPKSILDVGCGTGEPLIEILANGFTAQGFDFSQNMVNTAQKKLARRGYSTNLVSINNMEEIDGIQKGEHDCILSLGSIYYARNFKKTFEKIVEILPPQGHFIFSLRNELFSLFSMNNYSIDFFWKKLIPNEILSKETQKETFNYLVSHFDNSTLTNKKVKSIDDYNIHSIFHNPLTVNDELLTPNSLVHKNTLFYHFHAIPPALEHSLTAEFRLVSSKLEENPTDWRGYFMASAFIIHAVKKA